MSTSDFDLVSSFVLDDGLRAIYAGRRARLADLLGDGEIAIIFNGSQLRRNRDSFYPFRPNSYFYYLCGFSEPDSWLVIEKSGKSSLFCPPKDLTREIWDGIRLGADAAPDALGVDFAFSLDLLEGKMQKLVTGASSIWVEFSNSSVNDSGLEAQVLKWADGARARNFAALRDLSLLLDEMRLVKDDYEKQALRRAGDLSARAHLRAMKKSANWVREGFDLREYHLEGEILHEFAMGGAQQVAYSSIVAAGANACVLHYRAGSAKIGADDLVLIDAGCELDLYAGDISRTFPASGRFSGAQRAVYEVVLAAQKAAIDACSSGATYAAPNDAALEVLSQGMLDIGLISRSRYSCAADVIADKAYFDFYMHRIGHWIGMDVHDCGAYFEDGDTLSSRILRSGMAMTIEPGIYIRPSESVPSEFHNIGIRIEDNIIINDDVIGGCEITTRGVPVEINEIEDVMS